MRQELKTITLNIDYLDSNNLEDNESVQNLLREEYRLITNYIRTQERTDYNGSKYNDSYVDFVFGRDYD